MLDDLRAAVDLAWRLPRFLHRIVDFERECRLVQSRLARRSADFLELARRAIFDQPRSPYRALLAAAGCELGDLERLVRVEGLEGALTALLRQGVYLTVDEFKGRRPVVRSRLRLAVDPGQLRNPLSRQHIVTGSGGSRGTRVPVPLDLENIYDRSLHTLLPILAQGGERWPLAVWKIPGGALPTLLQHALRRELPSRWFLLVDPSRPGVHPRYRWSGALVGRLSRLAGRPLPVGESISLTDPMPIVRWMATTLARGDTPHLDTFAGVAVELCRAARQAGVDLSGARLSLAGEPLTVARQATIRATGAQALSRYSTSETGPLGTGCLDGAGADDQHLLEDGHAVIQAGAAQPGWLPAEALLVTSLRTSTSLVHLNVALGDRGVLDERRCGCPVESIGWRRHLREIRSYEKLTAHGMTFLDVDVVRVLEETLPARFGGSPSDYQLVETADPDGQPRLILRIHPRVPEAAPEQVAGAFLAAISAGGNSQRLMGQVWLDAGVVRVVREMPAVTAGGKILHVVGR